MRLECSLRYVILPSLLSHSALFPRHCGPFYVVPEGCECVVANCNAFLASLAFANYPICERWVRFHLRQSAETKSPRHTPSRSVRYFDVHARDVTLFRATLLMARATPYTRWKSTTNEISWVTFCRHAPLWWCRIQNDRFKQCAMHDGGRCMRMSLEKSVLRV